MTTLIATRARRAALVAAFATLLLPAAFQIQAQDTGLTMGIVEARQKNAVLMKQYSWSRRVEIQEKGETKDTRIDTVTYGPDGHLQYTLINDQGSPLPHGFLRHRIAEKEKEKMEKYIKDVCGLLGQYSLPTAAGAGTFFAQGKVLAPGPDGVIPITGSNVVQPGDSMTVGITATTRLPATISVNTSYGGDAVTFTGTFKSLKNGLNYLAFTTVTIPSKNLTIQVHNFDYINQNN